MTPYLQGISIGTPYDSVVERLGPASHVATTDDGLARRLSYDKLNTFFTFERGQVRDLGLYDPSTGPLEFSKPASAPASAPSEPPPAPQPAPEAKPVLDHCAPGLSKAERLKRLAQHGTVRETGAGEYQPGGRTINFIYDDRFGVLPVVCFGKLPVKCRPKSSKAMAQPAKMSRIIFTVTGRPVAFTFAAWCFAWFSAQSDS